jgi:acyl carrier protein
MDNRSKYDNVFTENLMVKQQDLPGLKYQETAAWDSVGHMQLMAALEGIFSIEMDIDDIIEFSSYEVGIEILKKYNVVI